MGDGAQELVTIVVITVPGTGPLNGAEWGLLINHNFHHLLSDPPSIDHT